MTTSHKSRSRSNEIVWTPLGERVKKATKIVGVATIAAAASAGIISIKTAGDVANVSATQNLEAMDKDIDRELSKGPQGKDIAFQSFSIGPSDTVANAMVREDERAHIGQSMIQLKATTASANNFNPEGVVQAEDEVRMWRDAELSEKYGHATLLAIPVERPEL